MLCAGTLLGFGMIGCSSDESVTPSGQPVETGGSSGAGGNGGSSGTAGTGGSGTEPFELEIHIDAVAPGVEDTRCMQVRLPNAAPVAIGRLVNTISNSSHHFVVSSIAEPAAGQPPLEESPTPTPCRPFLAPLLGAPLAITQKHNDAYQLPQGIGYALVPNQMIHLELHFINSGTEPVNISARTQLYPLQEGELEHEASVMVVGNLNVTIPPNSDHTLGPTYKQVPPEYEDVNIYAMTGHTHRYGTNVHVDTVDAENGTPTPRYALDQFIWDAPEVVTFEPAFKVTPGGGFSYSCSWHNPTPNELTFGESANQEMCFFWVYYYPRMPGRALLLTQRPPAAP